MPLLLLIVNCVNLSILMAVPMPALAIVAAALTLTPAAPAILVAELMPVLVVMTAVAFVMMTVMIAMSVRIIFQAAFRERLCRRIR